MSNATRDEFVRLLNRIKSRAAYWYRLHVKRDPFLRTVQQWFRDKGDETLRLEYPLDSNSLVVDVGGYQGDFADAISKRFDCHIVIFEPVPEFYVHCVNRFAGNSKIKVINCGLGAFDGDLPLEVADDASSFNRSLPTARVVMGKMRKADSALGELGINRIDLMKINIEGGEYDLLEALIASDWIRRIQYLQVQFHNFVPEAEARREAIRAALSRTHKEMWNYDFVWESWSLGE